MIHTWRVPASPSAGDGRSLFDEKSYFCTLPRRSAGVVELARLESVYTRKGIKGSNPFSSASFEGRHTLPAFFLNVSPRLFLCWCSITTPPKAGVRGIRLRRRRSATPFAFKALLYDNHCSHFSGRTCEPWLSAQAHATDITVVPSEKS